MEFWYDQRLWWVTNHVIQGYDSRFINVIVLTCNVNENRRHQSGVSRVVKNMELFITEDLFTFAMRYYEKLCKNTTSPRASKRMFTLHYRSLFIRIIIYYLVKNVYSYQWTYLFILVFHPKIRVEFALNLSKTALTDFPKIVKNILLLGWKQYYARLLSKKNHFS